MVAALWAHNASIQLQVDAQEMDGASGGAPVQAMDLQRDAEEVLASAPAATEQPNRGSASGRRRRSGADSEETGASYRSLHL